MAKFFINRPIVAMVIAIVMILIGLVSLRSLPISQYPEIVPPEILVSTNYTGANAVAVEQSVATPIEQQMNGVDNSIYMRSVNANDGAMQLRVDFEVGSDLDISNVLVQNRLSQATASLPEEVNRVGVTVKKSLAFPLVIISLHSPKETYDNYFLNNYAAININDTLARIPGVGQVNILSGSEYAMRIWLKPDRMGQLGVTVSDVSNAIRSQNVLTPAGQIGGPPNPANQEFTYTVHTLERLLTPEEFDEIIVRSNPDGSQIRLKDIARIELGSELYTAIGRLDGKPSGVIGIYQMPGSNALKVAEQVKKTMEELSRRFPRDLEYAVSIDTTAPIVAGIDEIVKTLFEAICLVILVVFIFLQNWRATLIPLLTIPVALIGTFSVFPVIGFSVNTLSLLGLVLAIGIVVDDAIIVVEAVMHHIEGGMTPREAALKAMEEVSGPVIAIALILSAVFVPVGFIGGITGRLYQQFAITIAISVLFSAFNALTLSPALSALLLRPADKRSFLSRIFKGFNTGFEKATSGYLKVAGMLTRKILLSVILLGAVVGLAGFFGTVVPGGFIPDEDQGYITINVQLPDAASLVRTDAVCRKVEEILKKNHHLAHFNTVAGYSLFTSTNSSNNALFFVSLKPWDERPKTARSFEIVRDLNREFAKISDAQVIAFGPPAILGLGTSSGFSMMIQDRAGKTPEFLAENVQKFMKAAAQRPELANLFTPYRASTPQIRADIDHDKVLKMGLSLSEVASSIGAFLGGSYINQFNRFGRIYKVYIEADAPFRAGTETFDLLKVRAQDGTMVPLSSFVKIINTSGPEFTIRFNLYRSVEIDGIPAPGYSSGQALKALEEVAAEVLPSEMGYDWYAMSYQEKKSEGTAGLVFALAIVFVFLILAAQYESWSLPFSVLLGTPFAVFGAFFGLFLARSVNNVFAQISLIMLVGLAAKNAILIVEFARAKFSQGAALIEAALESAKLRFRPILMTAFAFILGVTPLLRASGAGAESRKVMGIAVFNGMLIATILGVLLIPAFFVLIETLTKHKSHGKKPAQGSGPAHEEGSH